MNEKAVISVLSKLASRLSGPSTSEFVLFMSAYSMPIFNWFKLFNMQYCEQLAYVLSAEEKMVEKSGFRFLLDVNKATH